MDHEEKRRRGKAYYAANREKALARQKARWALGHVKEINRKAVAKYRSANKAKIAAKSKATRDARRQADPAGFMEKQRQKRKQGYYRHVERERARANAYGTAHAKQRAKRAADWRKANPDRRKELNARAQAKRKERWIEFLENERQRYRKNYELDPGKYSAKGAARRAATLRATPPWCDLGEIIDIYRRAQQLTRETGINHDVDHIVPLRGKHVRGLHVPWNLQILTSSENRKKLNRLIVWHYASHP